MLLPSHIKLLQIAKGTYTYRHIFDLLFVILFISYFKAFKHMLRYQFLGFKPLVRGIY